MTVGRTDGIDGLLLQHSLEISICLATNLWYLGTTLVSACVKIASTQSWKWRGHCGHTLMQVWRRGMNRQEQSVCELGKKSALVAHTSAGKLQRRYAPGEPPDDCISRRICSLGWNLQLLFYIIFHKLHKPFIWNLFQTFCEGKCDFWRGKALNRVLKTYLVTCLIKHSDLTQRIIRQKGTINQSKLPWIEQQLFPFSHNDSLGL